MPQAITFDVTGTLIHSPRLAEIYAEVLGRHGVDAGVDEIGQTIPRVWEELDCSADMHRDRFTADPEGERGWWQRFLARVCEHLGAPPPTPFATAELLARFARADAWEVYPDVPEALAELSSLGLALGVVSNWDHRLPTLLDELGLGRHLSAIVYSADVGVEKPHPRIFERALAALGTEPAEALHVGDSLRQDVEGALAVGMEALLLVRPESPAGHRVRETGEGGGDLADLSPLPRLVEVSRAGSPFEVGPARP